MFYILFLVFALPSWLIQNDRVINVDEPRWIVRGANFYYAVTHGEFEKTIFEYHPGVTNMWIVGTAMHIYFPEYRGMGQGYFDPLKTKFEDFIRENDKDILEIVRISRWLHTGVLAIFFMFALFLLSKLVDIKVAFLSTLLAAVSPFYLGHSRLMNLEGMLAIIVLISLLSLYIYTNKEKNLFFLLLSGISFGLAQLTKSSSIVLLGTVGIVLLISILKKNEEPFYSKLLGGIRTFLIWFVSAVITYFILWPGMWVAPVKMVSDVYGNAFSYAFQGARLDVKEELAPESFNVETNNNGILNFAEKWTSSTTPISWLGLLLTIVFLMQKNSSAFSVRDAIGYLFLLATSFMVLFGLAQGRDSQHYILSSYVAFDVIAGIGWGSALLWVGNRWKGLVNTTVSVVALVVITLAQIGFGVPYAPYYFTYKNPFAKEAATYGYGEGFSEAADYLAQKPGAKDLTAYVYNGMGTFSYFFPGKTIVLKRANVLYGDFVTITEELRSSDYLVLYPIVREKQPETEKIFGELEGVVEPEKVIYINGLEYIQIYKVADIPESVYEKLLAKNEP